MASLEKQGFKFERKKKRRHSYTSARAFAAKPPQIAPPLTPTHSLTSFQRSGSLTGSYRSSTGSDTEEVSRSGRRSFIGFLRSKKKKRNQPSSQLTSSHTAEGTATATASNQETMHGYFDERKGEFVRVVSTVLNRQIYYKTLPITKYTTVFEVVVKLVGKYAKSDDQNPSDFYLTEVKESDQGSYSRLLENSDRVYDIQSRWDDGTKCSFTLCRKETLIDDVFQENPMQAMIMSPSQEFLDNGFTGVVDIDVPSTPTSPNTYNSKSSFFDGPLPPSTDLRMDPFLLSISPSELSADEMFFTAKQNTRTLNSSDVVGPATNKSLKLENNNNHNNIEGPSAVDVSRLMQQSVSEGILGVMHKVVLEGEQRTNSPKSNNKRLRGKDLVMRPLICSPMESAKKRFPEFIFTPKPTNKLVIDDNSRPKLSFEEADGAYAAPNMKQSSTPLYKTTHTLSNVRFASTCMVYPRYHCSASLYPSFSRNTLYNTAMDMTNTLNDILENQLRPQSEKKVFQLSSPPRKRKTSEEQRTPKLKLKQHHTFHVRRDHLQLHMQEGGEMIPSFRDHLVQRAAQAIRQRHSTSNLRLSGGDSLPKLTRIGSNSTTLSHGSTHSIGSEIATDLDVLRDLRSRQSSYSSDHSLSVPPHVIHSRTDSDGVFEVRPQGRHRGSSIGSIQATGLDSTYLRSYSRKTSNSSLASVSKSDMNATVNHMTELSDHVINSAEIIDIEEAHSSDDEVLYTFQNNYRPVTVLVESKSAGNLREGTVNSSLGGVTTTDFRERVSSEGRREMWDFSQQREQRRTKSWLSDL